MSPPFFGSEIRRQSTIGKRPGQALIASRQAFGRRPHQRRRARLVARRWQPPNHHPWPPFLPSPSSLYTTSYPFSPSHTMSTVHEPEFEQVRPSPLELPTAQPPLTWPARPSPRLGHRPLPKGHRPTDRPFPFSSSAGPQRAHLDPRTRTSLSARSRASAPTSLTISFSTRAVPFSLPAFRPLPSSSRPTPVPREVPRVQEGARDRPGPGAHHPVPRPLGGRPGRVPRPARLPGPGPSSVPSPPPPRRARGQDKPLNSKYLDPRPISPLPLRPPSAPRPSQFNSALGPYKGGLRLHPTVNLSILKLCVCSLSRAAITLGARS